MRKIMFTFIISFLMVGCTQQLVNQSVLAEPNITVSENISQQNIAEVIPLSKLEVIEIANKSECMKIGNLSGDPFYNNYTKTWLVTIYANKKVPCYPDCIVEEKTRTAKINWRCVGPVSAI